MSAYPSSKMRIYAKAPVGAAQSPGVVVIIPARYRASPAKDAWEKMLAFLGRHLKK